MISLRTDLALEAREIYEQGNDAGHIPGVKIDTKELDNCIVSKVEVLNEEGANIMNKGIGIYTTIESINKFSPIIEKYEDTLNRKIEKAEKDLNDNINTTKKDIKESEVRAFELIGLFTAVIAFIVGGVQGFSFVKSIWSAFAFLFVFSTCLFSFLLIMLLITGSKNDMLKKHKKSIIFVYIVLIILIVSSSTFVFYFENKPEEKESTQNSQKKDIVKKENVSKSQKSKKDSIIYRVKKIN